MKNQKVVLLEKWKLYMMLCLKIINMEKLHLYRRKKKMILKMRIKDIVKVKLSFIINLVVIYFRIKKSLIKSKVNNFNFEVYL
jgi:hypothetical protein